MREINSSCGEKEFHGRDSISEGTLKMRKFFPQVRIAQESHSRWRNGLEHRHGVVWDDRRGLQAGFHTWLKDREKIKEMEYTMFWTSRKVGRK